MNRIIVLWCALAFLCVSVPAALVGGGSAAIHEALITAREASAQRGSICFDPTVSCNSSVTFQPWDLPFRIPKKAVIWESQFFYAIILKSIKVPQDDCGKFIPEEDRLAAQALFPHRKVFTSRCTEPGEMYYSNTAPNAQIMAVYAGANQAEAKRTLAMVNATGNFPGANVRRMRAGFNGT